MGEPRQGIQQLPAGWVLDGKYRIGMTLGQGGFGITYLAYDMNLRQKVAIKEYFPGGLVTRSSQMVTPFTQSGQDLYLKGVDAFYREARLLACFQTHPNIVHIFNFFRENNTAYFVMEYVKGRSLSAYLDERGGRLPAEELIGLLRPVMDALDELHGAGILHRDIAPDNICLTEDGMVKLLDFGAAKNELSQHTHSSAAILKPGYAPLEQYSVTGNQGPWTDVYAMGAVFYRCLSGVMPPDAPDRITGRECPPLSAVGVKVPARIENAVMKALALSIPDRWQRMKEFRDALTDPNARTEAVKPAARPAAPARKRKPRSGKAGKKFNPLVLLIPILVAAGAILGWFAVKEWIPGVRYDRAERLLASGDFQGAQEAFTDLADFRDSPVRVKDCETGIREACFAEMLDMMVSDDRETRKKGFATLEDFRDPDHYDAAMEKLAESLAKNSPETAAARLAEMETEDALQVMENINRKDQDAWKDIQANLSGSLKYMTAEIGDIIIFGSYEQDNDLGNEKEPIEWIVLDKRDNQALLLSKYALDCFYYYGKFSSVTWETSTIRKWLNNDFLDEAFTSEQKASILKTTVTADKNPKYKTDPGNDTEDMMFLLSINEVERYLPDDSARRAQATAYAVSQGAFADKNGNARWWLRSPGYGSHYAAGVHPGGSIYFIGHDVNYGRDAVRPALWINLESGIF